DEGQPQRGEIMLELLKGTRFQDAVTAGAAGKADVGHHHADGFADADGRNREVGTAQSKGGQAQKHRNDRRRHCPHQKRQERINFPVNGQRRGVGAHAIEDGESKGNLPGKAAQQVPGNAGGHPEQSKKKEPDEIGTGQGQWQNNERDTPGSERNYAPPLSRPVLFLCCSCGGHATRRTFASRLAMPPGNTISTTTSRPKEIANWYPAGTKIMLKVSTRASTSAPNATPEIESSPPSTMITNARIRKALPKSG